MLDTDLRRYIVRLPRLVDVPPPHSPVGPSSATRLTLCPGSYRESLLARRERPVLPETVLEAARFGTEEHRLVEEHLHTGTLPDVKRDPLNPELKVQGEASRWHIRAIAEDVAAAVEVKWLLVEEMLDGRRLHPLLFGTVDAALLWRDKKGRWHLTIYDLKSGIYPVPASALQLQLYAGLLLVDERTRDLCTDAWQLETVVVQPYNDMHGVDGIARADHTQLSILKTLFNYAMVLHTATGEAMTAQPLMSGKHCLFCPARVSCPALAIVRVENAMMSLPSDSDDIFDV